MQVLQWLFKLAQDQKQADLSKFENKTSKVVKEPSKNIVSYKHKRGYRKAQNPKETSIDCKNFRYITLLLKKGSSTRYFSSTLHKRRLSGFKEQYYILSMKMEEFIRSLGKTHSKADLSAHVGNKVLPISDSTSSTSSNTDEQKQCVPSDQKKDRSNKGETNRNKTLSRMKELLRWAATAKSEKRGKFGRKVLHFRNKSATIKGSGGIDEELRNESPKISLKWEVESCVTSFSVASAPPSMKYDEYYHRTGNWITTDDEFVVLEL